MKKQEMNALNKNFVASTKSLDNGGEARISKTNKPINKQPVHLD
jgi:hypothetical protein